MIKHWQWALAVAAPAVALPAHAASMDFGATAVDEIYYLSENLAGRSVGTEKEAETVDYLIERLQDFGYEPSLQPFTYEWESETLTSYNITAEREGTSGQEIIVGAHYDTDPSTPSLDRSNLEGTNDNASGVGVLLELAQRLDDPADTVKFVLFGAEEIGLVGSEAYASSLSESEIEDTIVMVNLDSVVFGDTMYFNAGRGATERPEWFQYRDLALEIADESGIDAETNPGLNPAYPTGTGCCSDLESFDDLVPVLAAEATNWEIGALDGYTQTTNPLVPGGATWHDPATDNLEFINEVEPGLIEERARNYTLILDTFIERASAEVAAESVVAASVPEPASVLATVAAISMGGLLTKCRRL